MKKLLLVILSCAALSVSASDKKFPAPERRPFSNVGIGISASTTGVGGYVATPLCSQLYMRLGATTLPLPAFNLTYSDLGEIEVSANGYAHNVEVPKLALKLKTDMTLGHVLFDWIPFRHGRSSFFITFGLYAGSNTFFKANGKFDDTELQQLGITSEDMSKINISLGDATFTPSEDFTASAAIKVWKVRPYFGIGVGRPIPKRRVGFRGELGVMYHGKPKIVSPNIVGDPNFDLGNGEPGLSKLISKACFYPQLSMTLTIRLLNDKKK